jgi:uncharacterized protein (TIGR00725 family)
VIGSGSEAQEDRAAPLGRWLAGQGVHLLTGGGSGVMAAVSRAFASVEGRRGLVLGVLPCVDGDPTTPRPGYPNPWVEVPIRTHLPLSGTRGTDPMSRNHVIVLTADVVIALPGGPGTASEAALAVRYGRPVIAFLQDRREIPGLPGGVQAVDELDALIPFVAQALRMDPLAAAGPPTPSAE